MENDLEEPIQLCQSLLSPDKIRSQPRRDTEQLVSFNSGNDDLGGMKLLISPDTQESKGHIILQDSSSFSTKAVEKQQLILTAGGSQQFFFNQRMSNQRKYYKPKNVNLKQMPGVRASQPEPLIDESKVSLGSQGNAKMITPS